MPLLMILLVVLVVGALTAGLVWLAGSRPQALADQAMPDPVSGSPFEPLPAGPIDPRHVRDVRFDQVVRGYRMSQVDEVLDRLVEELRERDAEIARLRGEDHETRAELGEGADGHEVDHVDPTTHPKVTTGPLEVSEIVRPSSGASLWTRPDRDDTES